jgi:hypothetical protein
MLTTTTTLWLRGMGESFFALHEIYLDYCFNSPQTKLSDIFLSYIFLLALPLKENGGKENVKEPRFQSIK